MKGFVNLHDLFNFSNYDIVCLTETHLVYDILSTKYTDYTIINSNAIKEKRFGRASGGLLIFVKKEFNVSVLHKCQHWIFVSISLSNFTFILGLVYFNYSLNLEILLDLLDETIREIQHKHLSYPMFIGGDFNCRVAELNQGDENIFCGTSLYHKRIWIKYVTLEVNV